MGFVDVRFWRIECSLTEDGDKLSGLDAVNVLEQLLAEEMGYA